jgi:predicted DCC family thiol-disulfide oxidoreductase YuxK
VNTEHPIWLYDGVCVLCSGAVHYVLKHERHHDMRFVSIQSEEGRALARKHRIDPDRPDTFLFMDDGKAFEKSAGTCMSVAGRVYSAKAHP